MAGLDSYKSFQNPRAFLDATAAAVNPPLTAAGHRHGVDSCVARVHENALGWDYRPDDQLSGVRACRDPPVEPLERIDTESGATEQSASTQAGQNRRGRGKGSSKGRDWDGGKSSGKG